MGGGRGEAAMAWRARQRVGRRRGNRFRARRTWGWPVAAILGGVAGPATRGRKQSGSGSCRGPPSALQHSGTVASQGAPRVAAVRCSMAGAENPGCPASRSVPAVRPVVVEIMPSVLRGCVRAPPRAPRATRGARRPSRPAPAGASRGGTRRRYRCRSRPAVGVRATPRPGRPPRPRRRGRCLTVSQGGRCARPGTRPRPRGRPRAASGHRGLFHREEARPFPVRQLRHF